MPESFIPNPLAFTLDNFTRQLVFISCLIELYSTRLFTDLFWLPNYYIPTWSFSLSSPVWYNELDVLASVRLCDTAGDDSGEKQLLLSLIGWNQSYTLKFHTYEMNWIYVKAHTGRLRPNSAAQTSDLWGKKKR